MKACSMKFVNENINSNISVSGTPFHEPVEETLFASTCSQFCDRSY